MTLRRPTDGARLTLPMHGAIRVGTLTSALRGAGIPLADFLAAL